MGRGLSKPTKKKIRELYAKGMTRTAIAKELGVHRETVAKYADAVDSEIDLEGTPAASLTEREVSLLQGLVSSLYAIKCEVCAKTYTVLGSFSPSTQTNATFCPGCGKQIEKFWGRDR